MSQYVVIGTSPFADTSTAAGPFRSEARIREAEEELTAHGWNVETIPLLALSDIATVTNDEGAA